MVNLNTLPVCGRFIHDLKTSSADLKNGHVLVRIQISRNSYNCCLNIVVHGVETNNLVVVVVVVVKQPYSGLMSFLAALCMMCTNTAV